MGNKKNSKLEKWCKNYAAVVVAIGCLYSVIVSWRDNWFMSALLSVGVIICGTIGFFDLKRILKKDVYNYSTNPFFIAKTIYKVYKINLINVPKSKFGKTQKPKKCYKNSISWVSF